MAAFDDSFKELIGEEGVLSTVRSDPGNWTGGAVGVGRLVGTKYGISAKAYPNLDIPNLTLAEAKAIAKRDYWDTVHGDDLPPAIAHALFDMAYNQGVLTAIRVFQRSVGVAQDGVLGSVTMAAFAAQPAKQFARAFTISRIKRYSMTAGWINDADGWIGRALDSFAEIVES